MRKSLILVGMLVAVCASAQQIGDSRSRVTEGKASSRVGINTNKPVATLEVSKIASPYANQVEGFMLPHLTQAERNNMKKEELTNGLQIFNIDKNCIDWWNGSTWQCTDGSMQDEHGAGMPYVKEAEYTGTQTFYKNNCPSGEQPKAGNSFTGTGKGKGVSSNEQDAQRKAEEAAYRNFLRLGQDYANANGECEVAPVAPDTDPITIIDPNLQIGNTKYWFSSIFDNDYLSSNGSVIMPTAPASWADQTPTGDGSLEKTLDVQGVIPVLNEAKTNGIDIAIPITTPPSTTLKLPGFTTYLEVPAEYTEDGRRGVMVFTWEPTDLTTSTKYFKATIYAKGSDINLKKLDIAKGMGSDHMGLSLGTVKYPKNSSDNDPSAWQGELDVRLISAIPDKRFNVETTIGLDTQKRHQFMYVPAMGPDGKIWFGNNLGANYANIHSAVFNPGQQAKTYNDYNAYGSLGQWGRVFDGHELMNWTSGSSGTPVFTQTPYNWTSDMSSTLTQFNENCPTGWHTPTYTEHQALTSATNAGSANITNKGHFVGGLRVPLSGYRHYNSGSSSADVGSRFYWWSSTPYSNSTSAYGFYGNTSSVSTGNAYRSYGFALRCLKD